MSVVKDVMPVVASIVLYKHSQEDLQPTIDSLLAEPLVETIVLVDNADSEWANDLNNSRIKYIKSEINGGYGHGHNQAMDKYLDNSAYFIICNPDIAFVPGTVASLYNFAENSGHRFIAPKIIYPNGEEQRVCRLLPTPAHLILRRFMPCLSKYLDENYELQNADYNQNFFAPTISGCFMFVESSLLKQLKGFDSRYFMYLEDVDLCRKVLRYENPMFCSEATVTHAFAKGSYKNLKLMSYHIRSAITYFNKWGWFFDAERRSINKECIQKLPQMNRKGEVK